MFLDTLNFRNNAIVDLQHDFINSCKAETINTIPVANDLVTSATDSPKQVLTNFLLSTPF
jgi:hypothetical protein